MTGYPEGDYWRHKQEALLAGVLADFDMLVELIETQLEQLKEPERIE